MVRIAAVLMILVLAAGTSTADITPKGPVQIGSTCTLGKLFSAELISVRTNRDGELQATLRITKRDPVHGLLMVGQLVPVGSSLGLTEANRLNRHPGISAKVRELVADNPDAFDPKTDLESIKLYPDWPIRACILVMVPDGWGCVDVEKRQVATPVCEVILREKGGRRNTLRRPNGSDQMPTDRLCTEHGGRISARTLSEEEKLEARAGLLLEAADENWKSKNPKLRKKAQGAYAKLLKESGSTSVVKRNKDRIEMRAEEDLED